MTTYIENPKSLQKITEITSELSKVAWYKNSVQKSIACLYTSHGVENQHFLKELFTVAPKNEI